MYCILLFLWLDSYQWFGVDLVHHIMQKKMIFEFINIKNLKFEPNYHEKTYQNETDWEIAFSYNDDLYKFNFTVEISNTAYIMQLREQITIQNSI